MGMRGSCNDILRNAFDNGLRVAWCPTVRIWFVISPNGCYLKVTKDSKGYSRVTLGPVNRRRSFTLGRLICWQTHGPPPTDNHMADHIDRNVDNDQPYNLRWSDHKLNGSNTSPEEKERKRKHMSEIRKKVKGEVHGRSKLKAEDVKMIRRLYSTKVWSQHLLAEAFDIQQSNINRIIRRKRWTHIT